MKRLTSKERHKIMQQGLESKMQIAFPVTMKKETGFDNLLIDSARLDNSYFEGLELETDDGKSSNTGNTSQTSCSDSMIDIEDEKERLR